MQWRKAIFGTYQSDAWILMSREMRFFFMRGCILTCIYTLVFIFYTLKSSTYNRKIWTKKSFSCIIPSKEERKCKKRRWINFFFRETWALLRCSERYCAKKLFQSFFVHKSKIQLVHVKLIIVRDDFQRKNKENYMHSSYVALVSTQRVLKIFRDFSM